MSVESLAKARAARIGGKREVITHTARTNHPNGAGKVTIEGYNRALAIKIHCTECMGHETDPRECTSPNCALFPFRKKTLAAYEKGTTSGDVVEETEEQEEIDG